MEDWDANLSPSLQFVDHAFPCRKKQFYLPVTSCDHPFDSSHSESLSPLNFATPEIEDLFATAHDFLVAQCSATPDTVAATPHVPRHSAKLRCDTPPPPQSGSTGLFLRHFKGCSAFLVRHSKKVRQKMRHGVARQD